MNIKEWKVSKVFFSAKKTTFYMLYLQWSSQNKIYTKYTIKIKLHCIVENIGYVQKYKHMIK